MFFSDRFTHINLLGLNSEQAEFWDALGIATFLECFAYEQELLQST